MTGATLRPRLSSPGRPRARTLGAAAALALLLAGAWVAVEAHAGRVLDAVPDTARALAATLVLFAVGGYAPARRLCPPAMRPHLPLLVLPLGAACASLALTFLGFFAVPFDVALVLVLALGVAGAVLAHRRPGEEAPGSGDPGAAGARLLRLGWPAYLALFLVGLTLLPAFREGFLTTLGENPDAHLVTGAAEVVREGPATSIQPDLPVDRVSGFWQSKYPIYYSLAAVATLSGLDPVQAFPVVSSVLLALFGLGVFLFAFHALGAGPVLALLAMGVVALDRVALYLVVHPYYNQLWGTFALPFMLLFGFRHLREPTRRSGALFLLFFVLGVFAYPLMLPFPAVALGVAALLVSRRCRREGRPVGWISALRLPRLRGRRAIWLILLFPVALVVLALALAGIDKGIAAIEVIAPGGELHAWSGDSPQYPFVRFFGLPDAAWVGIPGLVLVVAGALLALRRLGREERIGMAAMWLGALLMAINFGSRVSGEYFRFKVLAFLGPVVLLFGVVGLGLLVSRSTGFRRLAASAVIGVLCVFALAGARDELDTVTMQAPPQAFELRDWAAAMPDDETVRVDIPPSGVQLWASYMLHEQPQSATAPVVATTYPYLVRGRKADFILTETRQRRPADAVGEPVRRNRNFLLYRMDPGVPGPDRSTRKRVQPTPGIKTSGGL